MSELIYLQCSPRGDRSYSTRGAGAFVEAYRRGHAGDEVKAINIFEKSLPAFDGPAVQAKYTILHGQEHSEQERRVWKAVEAVIDEFKAADKYLLSIPMWNFGIPYRLKQYFDILVQPGYTFSYSEEQGYKGLVTGKPICLVLSRGGEYLAGSAYEVFDLQKKYLQTILGFIGFRDIKIIVVEPTLAGGPERARQKLEAAMAEAKKLALDF